MLQRAPHWRQAFSLFALLVFVFSIVCSALPFPVAGQATTERPTRNQNPNPPIAAKPSRSDFSGVIIDNGTIQLGVNPEGNLIVDGGSPTESTGTTEVGLRYMPENTDAISPDCNCEGWGVGDAVLGLSGHANLSYGDAYNLTVVNFSTGIDENGAGYAISEVEVGDGINPPVFLVTHNYHASAVTPNVYEVSVTIQNISAEVVQPRYRRVMDWDVEPTPYYEYVTLNTGSSADLLFASDDGFASADPFAGQSQRNFSGNAVDNGPSDHGALFDFGFAPLEPEQQFTFQIFYGATADENSAMQVLSDIGAEVYSLGQPSSSSPSEGTPNTYIFAFATGAATGAPIIEVDPVGLTFTMAPGVSASEVLNINNIGTATLYWNIEGSPHQTPGATGLTTARGEKATFAAADIRAVKPKGQDNRGAVDATVNAASVFVVEDGSFEAGSPNPYWVESSLNGPDVIGRYRFAHSGSMLAWFGGYPVAEESSISQDVTFDAGLGATLRFYTMFGRCDNYDDYVEVLIDGQQVALINGYNGNCHWATYTEHTVDVSAFADGGVHNLTFHSATTPVNGSFTNIFVDDVAVEIYTNACELPGYVNWLDISATAGATMAGGNSPLLVSAYSWATEPGVYRSTLCIHSNDPASPLIEVPVTMVVESPSIIISVANTSVIGGRSTPDEDLMVYNQDTGEWKVLFDGSDVGLNTADIDAFDLTYSGSLLLSFDASRTVIVNGVSSVVADADILEFYPSSLGNVTSGAFYWFLDASDVGLTTADEDIDAIDYRADGRLSISTLGAATVQNSSGVNFTVQDEDILLFAPTTWGQTSSGSFEQEFDGSDVGLATTANEDIWGLWVDESGEGANEFYLTTRGAFDTGTVSGDGNDIFICKATSLGSNTSCDYRFFWDGGAAGIQNTSTGAINPIDGLNIGYVDSLLNQFAHSADAEEVVEDNALDIDQPGHEGEEVSDNTEEVEAPTYRALLPLITK
jgi:hypothetical protein